MKALLVSGGNIGDTNLLRDISKDMDFIIAVDRGTDYCLNASLIPDIIVGDLDSINENSLKTVKKEDIPILQFPVEKDETDTELAIEYLINKDFQDITIVAAIGSRMDHSLGNIFLLKKLKDNKLRGKIVNEHNVIYLIDRELKVENKTNTYVSIIPITEHIVVTLEGFKYNLYKRKIDFSSTLGISNEIEGDIGYIKIHMGEALVFLSID